MATPCHESKESKSEAKPLPSLAAIPPKQKLVLKPQQAAGSARSSQKDGGLRLRFVSTFTQFVAQMDSFAEDLHELSLLSCLTLTRDCITDVASDYEHSKARAKEILDHGREVFLMCGADKLKDLPETKSLETKEGTRVLPNIIVRAWPKVMKALHIDVEKTPMFRDLIGVTSVTKISHDAYLLAVFAYVNYTLNVYGEYFCYPQQVFIDQLRDFAPRNLDQIFQHEACLQKTWQLLNGGHHFSEEPESCLGTEAPVIAKKRHPFGEDLTSVQAVSETLFTKPMSLLVFRHHIPALRNASAEPLFQYPLPLYQADKEDFEDAVLYYVHVTSFEAPACPIAPPGIPDNMACCLLRHRGCHEYECDLYSMEDILQAMLPPP